MSTVNKQMIYNEVPVGVPVPGKTIKLVEAKIDLEAKLDGGILTKNVALSLDPYMRGRMRKPEVASYSPPFTLGEPLGTLGVGEVVRTDNSAFKVGDHVYGFFAMEEYSIVSAAAAKGLKVIENPEKLPWTYYVGAAGMPGHTAHWSFYNIGKPKKGETIFVSAASGAVGQVVCQLAKREGLKVIASAGSDDKVAFLESLGSVDVAFNYKTTDTKKILEANRPDIFFDNVGGQTLESVLSTINTFGRIIACGAISDYNTAPAERYPIRNTMEIVGKQLTYQGFIISGKDSKDFYATVPKWIANGEIKVKEDVRAGLDNGESFVDLLSGKNHGKLVLKL